MATGGCQRLFHISLCPAVLLYVSMLFVCPLPKDQSLPFFLVRYVIYVIYDDISWYMMIYDDINDIWWYMMIHAKLIETCHWWLKTALVGFKPLSIRIQVAHLATRAAGPRFARHINSKTFQSLLRPSEVGGKSPSICLKNVSKLQWRNHTLLDLYPYYIL